MRPERVELRTESKMVDLSIERDDSRPERADFRPDLASLTNICFLTQFCKMARWVAF